MLPRGPRGIELTAAGPLHCERANRMLEELDASCKSFQTGRTGARKAFQVVLPSCPGIRFFTAGWSNRDKIQGLAAREYGAGNWKLDIPTPP